MGSQVNGIQSMRGRELNKDPQIKRQTSCGGEAVVDGNTNCSRTAFSQVFSASEIFLSPVVLNSFFLVTLPPLTLYI